MTYDDAVTALYRAPLDAFVAERKRLGLELKQAGDKGGAALLSKSPRPSVSAWVVNQLWWEARAEFDELFASGARVRSGQLVEAPAHRQTTNQLVSRAAKLLAVAGHSASEATLRKVSANLAALAARGSFEPDAAGALRGDRDPPGFDAMSLHAEGAAVASGAQEASDEERERAQAKAEEARRELEAQARARAERERLMQALKDEQEKVVELERERSRQQNALAETETNLERARSALSELEARLAKRLE